MDNGYIDIPEWSLYDDESEWVLENHGVDPDIEVDNLPGELAAGHDKQSQNRRRITAERHRRQTRGPACASTIVASVPG